MLLAWVLKIAPAVQLLPTTLSYYTKKTIAVGATQRATKIFCPATSCDDGICTICINYVVTGIVPSWQKRWEQLLVL